MRCMKEKSDRLCMHLIKGRVVEISVENSYMNSVILKIDGTIKMPNNKIRLCLVDLLTIECSFA